jgi:hypothetical protein
MNNARRFGLLLAAPVSVLALGGAAGSATFPYHGEFTGGTVSGDCAAAFPGEWSGVWNVQIPTPGVAGSTAFVELVIRYNNRPHATWRFPFALDQGTTATRSAFAARAYPGPGDEMTVSLAADGTFTHTHTFNFTGYYCYLDLTGRSGH